LSIVFYRLSIIIDYYTGIATGFLNLSARLAESCDTTLLGTPRLHPWPSQAAQKNGMVAGCPIHRSLTAMGGIGREREKIPQKIQQIPVSSPSNLKNRLNQQKTKEKKLLSKWHSSYLPSRIIKAVGNKQTRPKRRAFAFNAPSTSRLLSKHYRECQ
jgi:hypothetical protein